MKRLLGKFSVWNVLFYLLTIAGFIWRALLGQWELAFSALLTLVLVAVLHLTCKNNRRVPRLIYCSVMIFVFCSMLLGKVCDFYTLVPFWDKYLHLTSGLLLTVVGYVLYLQLDGERDKTGLTVWFSFLFSLAAAGAWEIYEFTTDRLLGLSSQNNSLIDTMLDIIAGTLGGFIACTALWRHLTKKPYKLFCIAEEEAE